MVYQFNINKFHIFFIILFLCSFTNASLVGPLRASDIGLLFVLFLLYNIILINNIFLLFLIIFITSGILSSTLYSGRILNENAIVFYYKYIFYFLSLIIIYSLNKYYRLNYQNEKWPSRKFFLNLVRILAVFHIFYILLFLIDNSGGAIGWNTRVSIPFTTSKVGATNSPAYSVVLALLFVYLYSFKSKFFDIILLIGVFLALMVTGSRSGIVVIFIYFIFFKRPIFDRFLLFATLFFAFIFFVFFDQIDDLFISLISRTLDFNLGVDQSANARVTKQLGALYDSSDHWLLLLGVGHENTRVTWYDGIVGNLFVFGGFVAFISFFICVFVSCHKLPSRSKMFVLLPVMASFISEFILTSYVAVFCLFLTLACLRDGYEIRGLYAKKDTEI